MAKKFTLAFASVGYLLVVFFWAFPITESWNLAQAACPVCPIVETLAPMWPRYLLIFGPLNASLFAAIGFVLGKTIELIRKRAQQH